MLQFLQPIYWMAFAGLLVPILIHLWNRSAGQHIKVGSIEFFEVAEEKRLHRLKLTDWWRLFLRLLLLSCFVLLLMAPHWQTEKKQIPGRKWALVDHAYLDYPILPSLTDSLQRSGYEIRHFSNGFPPVENTTPTPAQGINYWSLLQTIPNLPVPVDSLFILAHPASSKFAGPRPALDVPIQWKGLPLQVPHYFLAKAWRHAEDIILLIGKSDSEGTTFHKHSTAFPKQPDVLEIEGFPKISIDRISNDKQWGVKFQERSNPAIPVQDSFGIEATVWYSPGFAVDKAYVEAGLRAVGKYLEIPATSNSYPVGEGASSGDWLFWLSESPVPDSLRQRFAPNLAIFQPGVAPSNAYFAQAIEGYHLVKRLNTQQFTRDQSWRLPHELIGLLFEHSLEIPVQYEDKRALAVSQVVPRDVTEAAVVEASNKEPLKPLFFAFWLTLLLLFFWERNL